MEKEAETYSLKIEQKGNPYKHYQDVNVLGGLSSCVLFKVFKNASQHVCMKVKSWAHSFK
jgi:hypothetical protein